MFVLNLMIVLLLQVNPAPASRAVVVGLLDGQQLAVDDPIFSGFIQSRADHEAVLLYRLNSFSGELKLSTVQRIDVSYKKGMPFVLAVTLKNGQKLNVESAIHDFVMVKGSTGTGTVTVKHPDPISSTLRLSTKKPNRKDDLTIQYLEFPL